MKLKKLLKDFLDIIIVLIALGLGIISFACFVLVSMMSYMSVIVLLAQEGYYFVGWGGTICNYIMVIGSIVIGLFLYFKIFEFVISVFEGLKIFIKTKKNPGKNRYDSFFKS